MLLPLKVDATALANGMALLNTETPLVRVVLPIASCSWLWSAPVVVMSGLAGRLFRSRLAGPVRISAKPSKGYWSIALYARNSDNFFHLNDREVKGDRVELILSDARDSVALRARYPDAIHVHPESSVGLLLARSLVLDANEMKAVIDARSSTRCAALKD